MSESHKPVVLIIYDGWGVAAAGAGNAISLARKPNFDTFLSSFPHTQLQASGEAVGLPKGEAGNSEVGHLNLGAGRIVYQDLVRINMAIADGSLLGNPTLKAAVDHVKKNNSSLHLMGLIGSGGVHSSVEHLYALLWLAKQQSVGEVFLHVFTDGRDSAPNSALQLITELEQKMGELKVGKISTIIGRYYAMDRDNRWERTARAYLLLTKAQGVKVASGTQAIRAYYDKGIFDEFVEPIVIGEGNRTQFINDNDAVIFFNFRPDRARQLAKAFVLPGIHEFNRGEKIKNLYFASLTEYEKGLPAEVAFPHQEVQLPLSEVVSAHSLRQLHIGETEKYAHVTYFFNGGREDPFPGEDRVHIPSPKVKTYDMKPEMSAFEITDYVLQKIDGSSYDFYVINFANADMLAHTGSIPTTVKAVETLDLCTGKIVKSTLNAFGAVVITADHGNAEELVNPITEQADTEHSANPVPVILISDSLKNKSSLQLTSGILADVAPTILKLLRVEKPSIMTGRSLV